MEAEAEPARSMFGSLFCAGSCVWVREHLSRPSGRPTGGRVTAVCVGGPDPRAVYTSGVPGAPQPSP